MKHLNEVLRRYKAEELPVKETVVGDLLISPAYRKQMKKDLVVAWIKDLREEIDPELAEIVFNHDGIMIVCQNDYEGFFTIENMIKIKNLDYDAEDEPAIDINNY